MMENTKKEWAGLQAGDRAVVSYPWSWKSLPMKEVTVTSVSKRMIKTDDGRRYVRPGSYYRPKYIKEWGSSNDSRHYSGAALSVTISQEEMQRHNKDIEEAAEKSILLSRICNREINSNLPIEILREMNRLLTEGHRILGEERKSINENIMSEL